MTSIVAEINAVDREHSLGLRCLPAADRDPLRERVLSRYGSGGRWIWESHTPCAWVHNPDGWKWIASFVGSRECVLLFDTGEDVEMFQLPSGWALESLLANSYGFEFYVTDVETSYLISFNHHDVLSCWGSAQAWLEQHHPGQVRS
jgi:hypothetical protein